MIDSAEKLKRVLEYERKLYIKGGVFSEFKLRVISDSNYLLWHYVKMLRKTEYYYNIGNKLLYEFYQRRKNKEGAKLGISIFHNCFEEGLKLHHYGSIIVNSHARIGKNAQLHGNNCIGNKGEDKMFEAPNIGDNLDLGVGASILGGIRIASNVTVGANSVVIKDCLDEGNVLIGIPAKPRR